MTVNVRKSCMCTAVEETDIEAILTVMNIIHHFHSFLQRQCT